jgi:hypothetical protein
MAGAISLAGSVPAWARDGQVTRPPNLLIRGRRTVVATGGGQRGWWQTRRSRMAEATGALAR